MKKMSIIFLLVMLVIVLSGCGTEFKQPSVEELGMVGVLGYDSIDSDKNKADLTVVMPISLPDMTDITKTYDANASVTHEALTEISRESDKTINLGQLRVVLFGKKLAEKTGIDKYVKDLYRNPQVGDNTLMAIVDGKANELLQAHEQDEEPIQKFLYEFLVPREDIAFSPFTTIHSYIYNNTNLVSDPMMPIIKMNGEHLKITGVALFKNDKMVTTIKAEDAKLLQGLAYHHKLPALKLKLDGNDEDKDSAMLSFVKSTFNIDSNYNLNNPHFLLKMHLSGILDDYNGDLDLTDDKNLIKLESKIDKQLEKEAYSLIKTFQKYKVDPVGFGNVIKAHYPRPWSKEKWDDAMANATFKIQIHTDIISTGSLK